MNFRLVLGLALLGIVVAATTVTGLVHAGWETALSAVVALITAGTLAARARTKFFLHGLLAGGIGSALTSITQALFIGQYLAHNPKAVDSFKMLPSNMSPAVLVVALIPLTAGLAGLITGLLTLVWAKFTRPRSAAA